MNLFKFQRRLTAIFCSAIDRRSDCRMRSRGKEAWHPHSVRWQQGVTRARQVTLTLGEVTTRSDTGSASDTHTRWSDNKEQHGLGKWHSHSVKWQQGATRARHVTLTLGEVTTRSNTGSASDRNKQWDWIH